MYVPVYDKEKLLLIHATLGTFIQILRLLIWKDSGYESIDTDSTTGTAVSVTIYCNCFSPLYD